MTLIERARNFVAETTKRGTVLPPRIQEAVNIADEAADRITELETMLERARGFLIASDDLRAHRCANEAQSLLEKGR